MDATVRMQNVTCWGRVSKRRQASNGFQKFYTFSVDNFVSNFVKFDQSLDSKGFFWSAQQ